MVHLFRLDSNYLRRLLHPHSRIAPLFTQLERWSLGGLLAHLLQRIYLCPGWASTRGRLSAHVSLLTLPGGDVRPDDKERHLRYAPG